MQKQMDQMNADLGMLGEAQWEFHEPTGDPLRIASWLEQHLDNTQMPMVDELLDGLLIQSHKLELPVCELDPKLIAEAPDLSWQRRAQAAATPIECKYNMGSFGPAAYTQTQTKVGRQMMSHAELAATNRCLAAADKRWVLIDAYSGGCGATVSAIQAGVFVKAAFEAVKPEIITFEQLTGQFNLGCIDQHNFKRSRIPRSHLWWTSSSCKDFSPLGSRKGEGGRRGGDHFEHQSKYAKAAGVLAIMFENVNGVATLNGAAALEKFKANSARDGYKPFLSKKVEFFRHEDPENRTRRLGVAFHESVDTKRAGKFEFPAEQGDCTRAADYLVCSSEVPN